jgi:YD repeat-containing protein
MLYMYRISIFLALSFLQYGYLNAQGGVGNALPTISSPMSVSPNAASLGKFGEIPVGYYTGIPSIGVPLYEINTGGLKLPISLDYHAGGVKVEDIASWVGIGWALNAGGVITRQVRGIPDDALGGYLQTYDSITKYINFTLGPNAVNYIDSMAKGLADGQQDLFFYNFGGASGKFIFDSSGAVLTIPSSRNKIEFGHFLGKDQVFKITDLVGEQYFFASKETTTYGYSVNNVLSPTAYIATSSWYLTQINNALNTDSITFSYGLVSSNIQTLGIQTRYIENSIDNTCGARTDDRGTGSNEVSGLRLTAIHFKNGSITFTPSAQTRKDLTSERSLSSIVIQNTDGDFYKKYTFYQSYPLPALGDTSDPNNRRLFLDSLSFSDGATVLGTYRFSYITPNILPSRMSYWQDLWGYYNGEPNSDLIPTTIIPSSIFGTDHVFSGADRSVHFNNAEAGTLSSIVYPTGGRTEFEYESNAVNNLSVNQSVVVGSGQFIFYPTGDAPRTVDSSFELTDDYQGQGGVPMTWTYNAIPGCGSLLIRGCPVTILSDTTGDIATITGNSTSGIFVHKGPVTVKLDIRSVTDTSILQNYTLTLHWQKTSNSVDSLLMDAPVGGLRVKKITNYTTDTGVASIKQYTYNLPDSIHHSSGIILSYPSFIGNMTTVTLDPDDGLDHTCQFITISSTPNATLLADQGSYVTYKYVREMLGLNGEFGRNDYQFTAADQYPDIISASFPFPPGVSVDWERGKPVHEKNFRYNSVSGQYELIKEAIHKYAPQVTSEYVSLKAGTTTIRNDGSTPSLSDYAIGQYATEAGWSPLINDTIRLYDQNDLTKYVQTTTSYTYNDAHFQPVTITSTNSKGETQIVQNKYPLDYTGLTATDNFTSGIRNLQNKNLVTPVIEKYTQLQNADGSNTRTMGGVLTSYRPDKPLPDTIWSTEFAGPSTSFTATSVSGGGITRDGAYKPQVALLKYDPVGNIQEQQKKVDHKLTYLWDYQSSYPIAEVVDADSASIAYTSFEADGTGNWTVGSGSLDTTAGITGSHSYVLSSDISKSGLNSATTYIVSYWTENSFPFSISGTISGYPIKGKTVSFNGHSWTLYVHKVTGQTTVTIGGSGHIDELRLYPVTAQMTTYTYSPLVGMTSQCDPGNRITYYEYDGLGRLKRVRDQDYNILKSMEYQYQVSADK